jgi:hypothetical protein
MTANVDGPAREYFACCFKLGSQVRFLLWFSDSDSSWGDGLYLDDQGKTPVYASEAETKRFGQSLGLDVGDANDVVIDLDIVAEWLEHPSGDEIDCEYFLDAWNLFGDIARSTAERFDADIEVTRRVYDKLFWGNNLSPVTPPGEHYVPVV